MNTNYAMICAGSSIARIVVFGLVVLSMPVGAAIVASQEIPDQVTFEGVENPLVLQGAGSRIKFIFDIYVGALYVQQKQKNEHAILCPDTPKRIALYFLYDEVSREKLQQGWREGFMTNNSSALLALLQDRFQLSLEKFSTMKRGDVIYFDYLPGLGTQIIVNQQLQGVIEGYDFMQAVLKVWIGVAPAQQGLKNSMMGWGS